MAILVVSGAHPQAGSTVPRLKHSKEWEFAVQYLLFWVTGPQPAMWTVDNEALHIVRCWRR